MIIIFHNEWINIYLFLYINVFKTLMSKIHSNKLYFFKNIEKYIKNN